MTLYPSRLTEAHLQSLYPEHWEDELKHTVRLWLKDMQAGSRPLTARTILVMRERFIRYSLVLKSDFQLNPLSLKASLDIKTVYAFISSLPVESYSNRHNTFYAIYSLARFLVQLGDLEEDHLVKLKRFRPKRVIPPKRTVLRDTDTLEHLRDAITPEVFQNPWLLTLTRTLIELLTQTGLRNTEACNLLLQDVDLENRRIIVKLGKGRKTRHVGISQSLYPYLESYLALRLQFRTNESHFFINTVGIPLEATSLGRIIQKAGKQAGLHITPHGLRRTFATLNAEQGRPLHLIQLALGHSDIRTTQEYLMTDQETVIEAMQGW